MRFILIIGLIAFSAGCFAQNCHKSLRLAFVGFKEALSNSDNTAEYFSRNYLIDQLEYLLIVDDEKEILHNSNVIINSLSNYIFSNATINIISCDSKKGLVEVLPMNPKTTPRYEFEYKVESGQWLINAVSKDYRKVIPR